MLPLISSWFLRLVPWVVSAGCLYGVFSTAPIVDIMHSLFRLDIRWLALAMVATCVNLLVRGLRTALISNRSDPPNLFRITAISNMGLALNAVLPGRVGEVARVFLNIRLVGVSIGQAVMTALIERVTDLVILSTLAWYALRQVNLIDSDYGSQLTAVSDSLMVLSAFLLLAIAGNGLDCSAHTLKLGFFKLSRKLPRLRKTGMRLMRDFHYTSQAFMRTSVGMWSLIISLGMWLMLAFTVLLVAQAMPGMELGFMSCLAIAALTTLASALPAAPGSWGTYEAVGILVAKQLAPQYGWVEIGAFIFASHVVQYLPILLIGLLSWLSLKNQVSMSALVNRNP